MKINMFAPEIDNITNNLQNTADLIDFKIYNQLKDIYSVMSFIKPGEEDEIRKLWLEVPRGTIKNFGDYEYYKEEGEVETFEEFKKYWLDFYPQRRKWYGFAVSKYKNEKFFYFDSKLIFSINETESYEEKKQNDIEDIKEFLDWLNSKVETETGLLKKNVDSYNKYIQKNLSYGKRFGRIKRKDHWNILGSEAIRLDEQIGVEKIKRLGKYVSESEKNKSFALIQGMTADDFFKYCGICYDANDYFKDSEKNLTPKEKYLRFADGRDAGLRNIPGDSKQAFIDWYFGKDRMGSHPFEICRGGNSTHISLYASYKDNKWSLRLAGSSIGRVEETVKMAVALYDRKIPFVLEKKKEIFQMVTGNDYIGIVPDYIIPRYCDSLFPKEDNIIDFMHLDREEDNSIISNAYWYPLEKIGIADI